MIKGSRAPQNPLVHDLRNAWKGSSHGAAATAWYLLWKKGFLYPRTGHPPPQRTAPFGTPGRRKILFTGHEATRTGAPRILLSLMQDFDRTTGAELFLVLERDGPLLEDFRRVAHVLVNRHGALYTRRGWAMRRILDGLANPSPELVVCNCADSWRLMRELRYADLPRAIALVHERMTFYDGDVLQAFDRYADRIVFPAEAVKAAAVCASPRFRDARVFPQGLLEPEFGRGDKRVARKKLREELGLHADTKIVLCCGTRTPRKGVDLFVQLAARVRPQSSAPVHFVWVGGEEQLTELTKYVQHDLALLALGSSVSFVPETADPERYFLAADIFALTSRDDPFPCVVHEAMACALPIVVFDGAGGAKEAVADGCGVVLPYLDIDGMARVVSSMLERPSDFAAMGERAERRVRLVYRFSDYAQRILDLCNELQAAPRLDHRAQDS